MSEITVRVSASSTYGIDFPGSHRMTECATEAELLFIRTVRWRRVGLYTGSLSGTYIKLRS
jgi:hypothetical protein